MWTSLHMKRCKLFSTTYKQNSAIDTLTEHLYYVPRACEGRLEVQTMGNKIGTRYYSWYNCRYNIDMTNIPTIWQGRVHATCICCQRTCPNALGPQCKQKLLHEQRAYLYQTTGELWSQQQSEMQFRVCCPEIWLNDSLNWNPKCCLFIVKHSTNL
jgi:hypothetical protein